jgi:hypothetical protein
MAQTIAESCLVSLVGFRMPGLHYFTNDIYFRLPIQIREDH